MIKRLLNLYLLLILIIFPVFVFAESSGDKVNNIFTKRDIANLVKPSVVRLGQHITGKIILAGVDINPITLKFKPIKNKTIEIKLDKYYTGSGFFINPDGYIVTNAHIISHESIKSRTLKNIIATDLIAKILKSPAGDIKKIQKYNGIKIKDFTDKVYEYLLKNSVFDLKYKTTMIDPKSTDKNIKSAINNGVPVSIVYSNDNFFSDRNDLNDIAVVKINRQHLPSLPVSLLDKITVGTKIYTVGFSGNVQTGQGDFLGSTITTGLIGKKKKIGDGSMWQVYANISAVSSGGPMLNKYGEVIGIVSIQTANSKEGNNLAFVIPLTVIQDVLKKVNIKNKEGNYGLLFKEALALKQQRNCKNSITKFESARSTLAFVDASKYVDGYIDECKKMIKNGNSIDTSWEEFTNWLNGIDLIVWLMTITGIITISIFSVIIMFLKKHLKVEEKEIKKLEELVVKDHYKEEFGKDVSIEEAVEENAQNIFSIESELIKYIKNSKESNIDDDIIKKELKEAGWNDEEIKKVFDLAIE